MKLKVKVGFSNKKEKLSRNDIRIKKSHLWGKGGVLKKKNKIEGRLFAMKQPR